MEYKFENISINPSVRIYAKGALRSGKTTILRICKDALHKHGYSVGDLTREVQGEFIEAVWKGESNMDKLHNDPNRAAEDVVDQARRQYSDGDFKIFRYRFVQEAEKGKKGGSGA